MNQTNIRQFSGGTMIMGFITLLPGALLYLTRSQTDMSPVRLMTERTFIMAAVIFTAIVLVLLKEYLTDSWHTHGQ